MAIKTTAKKKAKTTSKSAIKKDKLPEKLVKYLEQAGVNHQILEHKTVYTAIDAAATLKKKMGEIVKSLLVKADKDYYLVLLPADHNLDFKKLSSVIGKKNKKDVKVIKIPGEEIMRDLLKIKKGTLSAFGSMHNLPIIAEKNLTKLKKAVFPSGSFNHSVEMAVKDFLKAENVDLAAFGVKRKIKIPKVVKKTVKKIVKQVTKNTKLKTQKSKSIKSKKKK